MRLPLFSENTLFATINIIHSRGLHSSTTALQQGGAQDTDSVAVARCSGGRPARNRVKVTAAAPRTFILATPGTRAAGHTGHTGHRHSSRHSSAAAHQIGRDGNI